MEERTVSVVTVVAIVAVVVLSAYGYSAWSAAAIQGLRDKYDYVIEAHVSVGGASGSLGPVQTNTGGLWDVNVTSIEFGSVSVGGASAKKVITTTNVNLINDVRLHVNTDLNVPGVHLMMGESMGLFDVTLIQVQGNGYTYQVPVSRGFTRQPVFQIRVDPGTPAQDIKFHIFIQYSFCND